MFFKRGKGLLFLMALLGALLFICSFTRSLADLTQENPTYISDVRVLDPNFNIPNAAGLAFSPQSYALLVLADHPTVLPGETPANLLMISPLEDLVGLVNLPPIASPINVAHNSQTNQLLLLDTAAEELLVVQAGPAGPDPAKITHFPAEPLGLQNPQGLALDPASGHLFILDSATSRIVQVEPDTQGGYDPASALAEGRITEVDLSQLGLGWVRGLAFNSSDGHLYLLNPAQLKLYEVTQTGQLVSTREMGNLNLGLRDPQGIVFAPSADLTDDPAQLHLFLIDSGLELAAPGSFRLYLPLVIEQGEEAASPSDQVAAPTVPNEGDILPRPGRIIEFNLTPPVQFGAAVSTMAVTLIPTTDRWQWSPPSPDPSGRAYLPARGALLSLLVQ